MGQALLGIGAGAAGAFGGAYDTARRNRQQSQMGDIEIQNAQREAASLAAAGNSLGALAGLGGGSTGAGGPPGMQGPPGMPQGGPPQPPMPQPGGAAMGRGSSIFPSPGQQVYPGQNPMGMPGQPPRPMQASFPGTPPPMPPPAVAQAPGGPPMPQMSAQAGMPNLQAMAPGGRPQPTMPFPGQQAPSAGLTPAQAPGGGSPSSSPPPGGLRGREQLDPMAQGRGGMPQPSSLDWQTIVRAVQKANPGAPPDVQIGAVSKLVGLMTPLAKAEWLQAHNQFLENQLRERRYETNIRYGRPQPTRQASMPGAAQPTQPGTQQASARGGPDLQGGERVIKAGLTESSGEAPPETWAKEQPPEVAQSPVVTGRLPRGHAFASSPGGYEMKPDDMNTALAIYQYRRPPLTSAYGQRDPRQVAIMNAVERLGVDSDPYDAANWDAHKKGTVSFTTGPQANTIRSIGVAQSHLNTLGELAKTLEEAKGGESNMMVLARINNVLRTQLGAPEANNIEAAKQIIAAEVVKAVNASGGGVKERLEASTHIDPSLNVRQMLGVIDTYQKLLNGQIKGFEGQWSRVPGNKDKDFYKTFGLGEKPSDKPSDAGAAPKGGVTPGGVKWEIEPFGGFQASSAKSKGSTEPWQPVNPDYLKDAGGPSPNIEDRRGETYEPPDMRGFYGPSARKGKPRSIGEIKRDMEKAATDSDLERLDEELQEAIRRSEKRKKK